MSEILLQETIAPPAWWVTYLTIGFTACLGLLSALYLGRRKDKREDRIEKERQRREDLEAKAEIARKLQELADKDAQWKASVETRMAVLNTQVSPLWLVAQQKLSADLHHKGERYAEMDALLEELDKMTIDTFPGHRKRLQELLAIRAEDMHSDITQDQRDSAAALLIIMKKVITESNNPAPLLNIGLVGVKEPSTGEGEHI